jgi:hypothetical protein
MNQSAAEQMKLMDAEEAEEAEEKALFARYQHPFEKSRLSLCWIIFDMLRPPAGRESPLDWEKQEWSGDKASVTVSGARAGQLVRPASE